MRRNKFWMEVEIKTSLLFPSGSAQIASSATATLSKVAVILNRYPNPIHVEGFTDNKPIRTLAFPSNWELSAARAVTVTKYLVDQGAKPGNLSAAGYGEFDPVSDNNTEPGKQLNRRIEIVLQPNVSELPQLPDSK